MDFETIQQSAFLQTLGSAILNSLWQVFICWLLYESIAVSFKKATAKFRHNLSTLLLFGSFIWFLTGFIYKIASNPSLQPAFNSDSGLVTMVAPTSLVEKLINYAATSIPYLSVAYIILLFIFILKLLAAYRYIFIVSNRGLSKPPVALQQFTQTVAHHIGLTRQIQVWISHYIDVPATIGCIKPMILIPLASLNNLSQEQLEAIILHELSHVKRNDYITNIVISVIETMLFFNPFVALLARAIRRERENCCDDFVLQFSYDAHSYATALMRLEQSRLHTLTIAIGAVSGKQQLLSRIKRITNGQSAVRPFNYGQKLLALLFVTAIIYSLAWISPDTTKTGHPQLVTVEKKTGNPLEPKISESRRPRDDGSKIQITRAVLHHTVTAIGKAFLENSVSGSKTGQPGNELGSTHLNPDQLQENLEQNDDFGQNFKEAEFLFKDSLMKKISQAIDLSSLSGQEDGIHIKGNKIHSDDLNKQLRWAFQQINQMDWGKIQGEIKSSLQQLKIEQLTQEVKHQLLKEDAVNLSKVTEKLRKQNAYAVQEKMQQELQMDRMAHPEKNKGLTNPLVKAQQVWQILQQVSGQTPHDIFSFQSQPKEGKKNAATAREMNEVNILIRQKQLNNPTKAAHLFQFSVNNKSAVPGGKSIINIELTDVP